MSGACKLPGNSQSIYKGYAFKAAVSNTTAAPVTVQITSVLIDGVAPSTFAVVRLDNCQNLGSSFSVPANTASPSRY